jgi:hypothetical protein
MYSSRSIRIRWWAGICAFFLVIILLVTSASAASTTRPFIPRISATPQQVTGDPDGVIPDDETLSPFDMSQPAIVNLDPELRAALQDATIDAEADGIIIVVTSGWRSKAYQQRLLNEAIATYGSLEEALKWVKTPDDSTHVSGDAVDIGFTDADYWMIENGYEYGLCQTYANEIWHFELAVEPGQSCPVPLTDATARVK